jgi:hypothetical protein
LQYRFQLVPVFVAKRDPAIGDHRG